MHCYPWNRFKNINVLFLGMDFTELINIKWHDNTSVSILDYEDGKFELVLEGDVSYLIKSFAL